MIEELKRLDTALFLFLNSKHNSFFDVVMFWTSDKLFWLPFYFLLLLIIVKEFKKNAFRVLLAIGFLITICDQTASNLIKNSIKRLRPSHEPALQNLVHLSTAGRGGAYGFISSHSANAFGLATFLILILPKNYNWLKIILLFWAILIAYSRIYNGVHYPLDVIVAMVFGIGYAFFLKILLFKFKVFKPQ
jgi:undecaprenyl-diphosphatase